MSCESDYVLNFLHHCSDEKCGQEAIENALMCGALKLTHNLQTDLHTVFDLRSNCCDAPAAAEGICRQCGHPAIFEANYDRFIETWQRKIQDQGDALVELYHSSGLMAEIFVARASCPCVPEPELAAA